MRTREIGLLFLLMATAAPAAGTPDLQRIAEAVRPSLVQVEVELRHADGEAPQGIGWGERCPNCGRVHGNPLQRLLDREVPLRLVGFLVGERQVVIPHLQIHPRFVQRIRVAAPGGGMAEVSGLSPAIDRNASLLELADALPNAAPLRFEETAGPVRAVVQYVRLEADWQIVVEPWTEGALTLPESGEPFRSSPSPALFTDAEGHPLGVSFSGRIPPGDAWKGTPLDWAWTAPAEWAAGTEALSALLDHTLVRVEFHFRSPRASSTDGYSRYRYRSSRGDDVDEDAAEHQAPGLVVAPDLVLVPSAFRPRLTERLERIHVYDARGEAMAASFFGSLRDFGALLIRTEQPMPAVLALAGEDPAPLQHRLLRRADVRVDGENRSLFLDAFRIDAFSESWRGIRVPETGEAGGSTFLFDLDHRLVVLPMQRRPRVDDGTYRYRRDDAVPLPAMHLAAILRDPGAHLDGSNMPRSEDEAEQLAWLGVELQPIGADLARQHGLFRQTDRGQTGGMVSHVYDNSPASRLGLRIGDILLRLQAAGMPSPVAIRLDSDHGEPRFRWEHIEQVPPQYFDQLGTPWPDQNHTLNRMLTDLGEGAEVQVDLVRDGESLTLAFAVEMGPPHFENTPRHLSEVLGLTVRDLTYETRRYFQRSPEDPGVLVSRIEPGGVAATAGLLPFEIITHIDGEPIGDIGVFARLTEDTADMRLTVRRMAVSRVLRLRP